MKAALFDANGSPVILMTGKAKDILALASAKGYAPRVVVAADVLRIEDVPPMGDLPLLNMED